MTVDTDLLETLVEALAASRAGAPTKPVSVTLPAPLAEALRLLANTGRIRSVSDVTARALDRVVQAHVVGLQLDALYDRDPAARPTEEEVAAMAARAGIAL